jgi:hypothetical protein
MGHTLKKAKELAAELEYETKDGGLGVEHCPECNEYTFAIEGVSPGGMYNYGECLYCGHTVSEEEAEEDELTYKIEHG